MSQPFIGEIRMFGGSFAPSGWALCDGRTLAISEYDTLFNLIGTTYGGDGINTFNVPDLRGRVPVHQGSGFVIGQQAGVESVTLTNNQLGGHTHNVNASNKGGSEKPGGNVWGTSTTGKPYVAAPGALTMNAQSIGFAGSNLPHDNMQPYVVVSYIISLFGIYPSQN